MRIESNALNAVFNSAISVSAYGILCPSGFAGIKHANLPTNTY